MKTYPQVMENVVTDNKIDIALIPSLKNTIDEISNGLGSSGRVLVRYSGTQPLLRIMVECSHKDRAQECVRKIVEVAKKELNQCAV